MTDDKPTSCPKSATCEMYSIFTAGGVLEVWKANYCSADYKNCERFRRSIEGRHVPINLLPNGHLLRKPVGH